MNNVIPINLIHLTKSGLILSFISIAVLVCFLPSPAIVTPFVVWFLASLIGFLLIYPRVGFYAFVISLLLAPILLNFVPGTAGLIIREAPLLLIYFLIFLIACKSGTTRIRNIQIGSLEIMILVLFFVMLAQALRQNPLAVGLLGFKSIMYYSPQYFLVLLFFNTREKIQQLISVMLFAGLFLALVSILQHIFTQSVMKIFSYEVGDVAYRTSKGYLKASATLGNPSAYAIVIGIVLLISLLLFLSNNFELNRFWTKVILIILGIGLILSFSRITFIVFLTVLFFLNFIYKRKMWKFVFVIILFLFVINLALKNFLFENFISSFGLGQHALGVESTMARVEIIKRGLILFMEKPLFGYGLGITDAPSRHYAEILKFGYLSTDNYYLKLLIESGIVGALLFISFLIIAILKGRLIYKGIADNYLKTLSLSLILGIILIALVSVANTALELPAINSFFWMMLGLITACGIADKQAAVDGRHLAGGVHL